MQVEISPALPRSWLCGPPEPQERFPRSGRRLGIWLARARCGAHGSQEVLGPALLDSNAVGPELRELHQVGALIPERLLKAGYRREFPTGAERKAALRIEV